MKPLVDKGPTMAADQSTTPRAEFDPCEVRYRLTPGHPGYRIGDDGSLLSCWDDEGRMTDTWRSVPLARRAGAYIRVVLRTETGTRNRAVHQLVLEAFVGPCPPGMEACHFPDKTRTNNRLSNLRWDTHEGNVRDRMFHAAEEKRRRLSRRGEPEAPVRGLGLYPETPRVPAPGADAIAAEVLRLHAEGIDLGFIAYCVGMPKKEIVKILKDAGAIKPPRPRANAYSAPLQPPARIVKAAPDRPAPPGPGPLGPPPPPLDTARRVAVLRAIRGQWRPKTRLAGEIARALGEQVGTIVAEIQILRHAGLVAVKPGPRHRQLCALTEAGKKAVRACIVNRVLGS
jgi:hypothetical protein